MNIEHEIRVLEINKDEMIKKLESLGAKKVGNWFYRRYVYDTIPFKHGRWIRLRTNGINTTLTYKNIISDSIDGMEELEIEVEDFDKTKTMFELMGFKYRLYQENKRVRYILNDVEIDIDSLPLIPPYMEIEGKSENDVKKIIKILDIPKDKLTNLVGEDLYLKKYNIDINKIKDLTFEGGNK